MVDLRDTTVMLSNQRHYTTLKPLLLNNTLSPKTCRVPILRHTHIFRPHVLEHSFI